jgi:uncharacterized glyoxalase superfamily protein PhnB
LSEIYKPKIAGRHIFASNKLQAMQLPTHHHIAMVYLIVQDPWLLQDFMRQVFNATSLIELPPRGSTGRMHAEARIGDSTIMFSGSSDQWPPHTAGIFIYVENADETLEKALNHNASVVLPLENQSYGRSGGIKDPCGNVWWITSLH